MNLRSRVSRLALPFCLVAGSAPAISCEADGLAGPGHGFGFWSGVPMHRHHPPSTDETDDRAQATQAARDEAVLASERRDADAAAPRTDTDSHPAAER